MNNSWTICISGEYDLNFLMFVASACGLLTDEFEEGVWPESQPLNVEQSNEKFKEQWKELWNQSISKKGERKRGNHQNLIIDPPDFSMIKEENLKAVLINMWPSFIKWWNMPAGGQMAMHYWEANPDLLTFVQEFESQVGREIKPFRLDVDLVYTGLREPIEVNEQFIIMPIKSEYLLKKDWWIKRFKEYY
ncbi:MAG TPA: hypothetical protein DEF35_08250 [Paenibacillus sp.]|uniref:hypothetical protein n=1 Tax=Paenibacillus TaxID=44249 RepID=UPI000BA0A412|nr:MULTISPECIES: hypothetical protein [Paenibacillus]OZQ67086.1 hypothetical protein CA599_17940 [Paenibacillus taichungensis]HBU81617.1 hypothetical protein [Paenibacillus sp.]